MNKLAEYLQLDPIYQQQLADLKEKEPAFLALMAALPEEERQIIEAYLSACEELDHRMAFLAGMQEGEMPQAAYPARYRER